MDVKCFDNIFIKQLSLNNEGLECFNLTDNFYKEFVSRNKDYMLYMLSPLRDLINNIIKIANIYKEHILFGCCVGFSEYKTVKMSIIFDCDVFFEKPSGSSFAIIKHFEFQKKEDKTILSLYIDTLIIDN